eukprot:6190612-Pleurochrysis_carterae.AAC.2
MPSSYIFLAHTSVTGCISDVLFGQTEANLPALLTASQARTCWRSAPKARYSNGRAPLCFASGSTLATRVVTRSVDINFAGICASCAPVSKAPGSDFSLFAPLSLTFRPVSKLQFCGVTALGQRCPSATPGLEGLISPRHHSIVFAMGSVRRHL